VKFGATEAARHADPTRWGRAGAWQRGWGNHVDRLGEVRSARGKTTLVDELRTRWPEALAHDPEMVGYVLPGIVEVPTGDFQDLRLWRQEVASLAVGLVEEYHRPALVPMTLLDPAYAGEIFSALKDAAPAR
jgi:hypothetical protein